VGDLSINGLDIEGIDSEQISRLGVSIQGVLGENFLKDFEILIDNHAKTLTLDHGSDLPLSFSGMRSGHSTVDRLVRGLKLPLSKATTNFLIDSGTNYATVFPSKSMPYRDQLVPSGTLLTFNGKKRCRIDFVTLEFGNDTFPDLKLASCEGVTRDKGEVDGTLPSMFDRLFISHVSGYVIANPRFLKRSANSLLDLRRAISSNGQGSKGIFSYSRQCCAPALKLRRQPVWSGFSVKPARSI
jgi:hypothetical protein